MHRYARLCALAAVVALAACQPRGVPGIVTSDSDPWWAAGLTADGADIYDVTGSYDSTTVAARPSNTGGNTRVLFVTDGPAVDAQESCATWATETWAGAQQGLALRWTGTEAITVTRNVWGGDRTVLNVHGWDLSSGQGVFTLIGGNRPPVIASNPPLPWRACARAAGASITWKVWPLTMGEPSWSDPCCSSAASSTLTGGRPGFYGGHIEPGGSIGFTDLSVITG